MSLRNFALPSVLTFVILMSCVPAALGQEKREDSGRDGVAEEKGAAPAAPRRNADDFFKWEGFVGYSSTKIDSGLLHLNEATEEGDDRAVAHGYRASVTHNFGRAFGFKLDTSGHFARPEHTVCLGRGPAPANLCTDSFSHSLHMSRFDFMGGVQFKDNGAEGVVKPFANVLVGAARTRVGEFTTETKLTGAVGGGIDIMAGERFGFRAFQIDYTPTRTGLVMGGATHQLLRVGTGIVFR